MAKTYENMNVDELEAKIIDMNNAVQEQRQEILSAHAVLDRKNTETAALRKIESLSDAEMAALMQHIRTSGIDASSD